MQRLWNRPNLAIWSLSTANLDAEGNMNICTYVSAVSLEPKLIMVALYEGTRTLANVQQTKRGLLQLLAPEQISTIRRLGKSSGNDRDKIAYLQKSHDLKQHADLWYFANCLGFAELAFDQLVQVGGDHQLGVARVITARNLHEGTALSTSDLRDAKLIS